MKKIIFCALLAIIGTALTFSAHGQPTKGGRTHWDNQVFKKSIIAGTEKNYGADSSCWIQVGDTGTTKGLWLPMTDTAKITKKQPGVMIFNKDSVHYYWNGALWKKVGT